MSWSFTPTRSALRALCSAADPARAERFAPQVLSSKANDDYMLLY